MFKNLRIALRTSIIMTLLLMCSFFMIWKVMNDKTSLMVNEMITNQMTDAVKTRTDIIDNFVVSAEESLISYAKSEDIVRALSHPDSFAAVQKAQLYTTQVAKARGYYEGLYLATTESVVLAHCNTSAVGMQIREGEALKQLQDDILSKQELTNGGIMKSPSSGEMVISMYYPVYKGQSCIGYVGAAVYANRLMDALLEMNVEGIEDCQYVFLNNKTGEYLYHENEEMLCTKTEESGYLTMLDMIANGQEKGSVEYKDAAGVEQMVVYQNIPKRDWVFALKDTKANIYSTLNSILRTMTIVCILVPILSIVVLNLILTNLGSQLKKIERAIRKLSDMDLKAADSLEKYSKQKDEVGVISNALTKACGNLNQYIGEVDARLSAMADGDFNQESTIVFAGEFVNLKESMDKIQGALKQSFTDIETVAEQLVFGSQSVSDSATRLAEAASEANLLVTEIDDNVEEISEQVSQSTEAALGAKDLTAQAADLVELSRTKMEELTDALNQISEATNAIAGISTNIETVAKQTNILALNALVEAKRAGESGSGFSVVANQIKVLAEQSNEAAANAYELIHKTIEKVERGLVIGEQTTAQLQQVVKQTNVIDESVTQIAEAAKVSNEKLLGVKVRLRDISKTVETTAAMAQQSAAASNQLDGQTNVLKENMDQFQV